MYLISGSFKNIAMNKSLLIAGALFGLIAVGLGAFGAHGLKPLLSLEAQETFETGVRYQMYSAFFLLVLGALTVVPERVKALCFYLTVVGVVLFSGSIYFLATNSLTSFDFRAIALLTPIGGTLLIGAWILLLLSLIKLKKK